MKGERFLRHLRGRKFASRPERASKVGGSTELAARKRGVYMKKFWSVIAAGALISSVFTMGAVQAAPEIPETANIEDPAGDANGHSFASGTAAGPSLRAADFIKVWFTHDTDNLYTHVLTDGATQLDSILYQIYLDPGVGKDCLQIRGYTAGSQNKAYSQVFGSGDCGTLSEKFEGGIVSEANEAKQGIHTITVPRSVSPFFADGATLSIPNGITRLNLGSTVGAVGIVDNTAKGTAYTITSGGGTGTPQDEEEPKEKKEPKGCKKGKGKKKGCGKGPQGPKTPEGPKGACAPLTPAPTGADAETIKITDAATAEAPVEIPVKLAMSLGDLDLADKLPAPFDPTQHVVNIQVDSAAADAGLYFTFEFPQRRDYDLFLRHSDDSEAASSHGFNTVIETPFNNTGTNHAGKSTASSENIIGVRTADCGGYTLEAVNWMGEGGNMVVKAWLGDVVNDPRPIGDVPKKK